MFESSSSSAIWIAMLTIALATSVAAAPAVAEIFTKDERARAERACRVHQEKIDAVLADPADREAWQSLIWSIGYEQYPWCRQFLARYRSFVDWQPDRYDDRSSLGDEDRAERQRWLALWREARPDDPEPWCQDAWGPEAIERLRGAPEGVKKDPIFAECFVRMLVYDGAVDEASEVARHAIERGPDDPRSYDALNTLLDEASPSVLSARRRHELIIMAEPLVARFRIDGPDHLARVLELLDHYLDHGPRERLAPILTRLIESSPATPLGANLRLCSWLEETDDGSGLADRCFAMLGERRVEPLDALEIDGRHSDSARPRLQLLERAITARDWDEIHRRIDTFRGDYRIFAWDEAVRSTRDFGGCGLLINAYAGGTIEVAFLTLLGREQLVGLLAHCGQTEWALELWQGLLPDLSGERLAAQKLDWHDELPARMRRELERRIAAPGADLSGLYGQLLDPYWKLSAAETVRWLEHWAASDVAASEPLLRASDTWAEAGNDAAAIDALERAVARRPKDPGLRLRLGVMALQLEDHVRVLAQVHAVLEAKTASPRQRAEARYLRGRVARREGRWEKAGADLAHYFLQRWRFQDPTYLGEVPDLGLLLLFHESGDRRGLERYLEARAEAAADHAAADYEVELGPRIRELLEGPLFATTIPYLERLAHARPGDREIGRRLEQARLRASERGVCEGPHPPFRFSIEDRLSRLFARPRPGQGYRVALRTARFDVCDLPPPDTAFDDAQVFADETVLVRRVRTSCSSNPFQGRLRTGVRRGWKTTRRVTFGSDVLLPKNSGLPATRYW